MASAVILSPAANGQTTARLGGCFLFSAYDPRGEAGRFVERSLPGTSPALVLVLGAGLGYLEAAAAAVLPGVPVRAVHYAPELLPEADSAAASWAPGAGTDLEEFVRRAIGEHTPEEVAVLEWPACARVFPEEARRARETVIRIFRENAFGELTLASSGRRWLGNALVNFISLDPVDAVPFRPEAPLVIAASGPSLGRALPLIRRLRESVNLWALASSLPALAAHGLAPDVVVTTDAGHYASTLLDAAGAGIGSGLLALPLAAARGAWRTGARVSFFVQPNFFEGALLARAGLAAPAVDAHGTVAGTALLLARALGARDAFFGGLDFCFEDVRSHVAPHAWDARWRGSATRLGPLEHALWSRAAVQAPDRVAGGPCRTGSSLALYATSFVPLCARIRAARLYPSPVAVPGMDEADPSALERRANEAGGRRSAVIPAPVRPYPDRPARRALAVGLLREWLACLDEKTETRRTPAGKAGRTRAALLRYLGGAGQSDGEAVRLERAREFLSAAERRFAAEGAHV